MNTKICTKCVVEKPATVEWFGKQKLGKYGLSARCKECEKEYMKEYQKNNKEKIKKYDKKYQKNNKEKIKEYHKEYYKEYSREYYEKNKEKMQGKIKEYRENNKENRKGYYEKNIVKNRQYARMYRQTRRTLKLSLPSTLTLSQWQSTKDHFNHECAYCGKQLKNLAQEHVIPLSKGGGYTKGNIVPSCKSCNSSKSASNMKTWYTTQPYFSIERYNKILAFIKEHKSIHDYTPITKEVTK